MRRYALVMVLLAVSGMVRAQDLASFTVEDALRIAEVANPVFSPDGDYIVYDVTTANLEADETTSDLWRVAWTGEGPRPLTRTPETSEWRPAFSADGRRIYFLSDAARDESTQLWRISAKGGRAKQISHLPGGISDFVLAPDGRRAIVVAEVGKTVGADPERTAPVIVIDRFQFKEDGRGWLDDRRQHLFLLDLDSGKATQLTSGDFDHWLPSWSPDGKEIAFVSKRRGDTDRNLDFDVFVMPPEPGAEARKVSDFPGTDVDPYWDSRPAWSPDSRKLAWLQSAEDKWIYYAPWQLVVADLETGALSTPARIDRNFTKPRWSTDGSHILALLEEDRDTWLVSVDPATDRMERLTSGSRFAYDFALSPQGRIVVLDGNVTRPNEISAIEPEGLRPLTAHNAWLEGRRLGEIRDISFMSGGQDIHGMLLLPPGHVPGERLPTILRIHGGPVYQSSHEFMADWQLYAANGYAVLAVNPRGSSGRGFDFARAIYADWGGVDVEDVLAGVDHAIASGISDPERLGVGGWSYGGILTDYVIASDSRFKAAISGAGMANVLALYGSDQYSREYELELGTPWGNREVYERLSYPFLHADRIRTPTLFQCAESDFNVPCIGSEQMYQALRSLGIETGLVIYPGENHGLKVPSYLADRLRRNLAWYDRFLKGDQSPDRP